VREKISALSMIPAKRGVASWEEPTLPKDVERGRSFLEELKLLKVSPPDPTLIFNRAQDVQTRRSQSLNEG
jgi:hypothetical protein